MSENVEASARTDTGSVRAINEDSYLARMPLFLVADGMGGHARGDKASREAVRVFDERIPAGSIPTPDDVLDAVASANSGVRALSEAGDTGVAVAGTTLTGIALVRTAEGEQRHWMVVNVGDSRVYNWDGRTLTQLTVDHSAVQELLDAGAIRSDEVAAHPERNVITRALGADASVEVDVWLLPAVGKQTFLVCSDGLCKELDDEEIARVLSDHRDEGHEGELVSEALVNAAISAGGRDNVTVIVVESQMGGTGSDRDATVDRSAGTSELLEDTPPAQLGRIVVLHIQQTAPGRWLAATVPGRLAVVECQTPSTRVAGELWDALSAGSDVQPVLDYLTRDGLLATPAFALLVWDDDRDAGLGRVRCIVRGSVTVIVDGVSGPRRLSADGVSTWLEQLIDDATAFDVSVGDGESRDRKAFGDEILMPLSSGASWVAGVRTAEGVLTARPAYVQSVEIRAAASDDTVSDDTVAEPFEPDDEPEPVAQEASPADVPAEPVSGYDHLFGATMMRSVEDAAVREDEHADEGEQQHAAAAPAPVIIDPPAYVTGAAPKADVPDAGDHDGMTVFSGDIHTMRAARAGAPTGIDAETESDAQPTPVAAAPRFTLSISGGATETLSELTLVGRAPSVSKVSGGRVPKLITVGSADQDISRNHVQLAVEGDTVVVTDLHSRNGTMIVLPGKSPQKLRQGEPTSVIVGTLVDLGGGVTMTVGQE